MIQMVLNKYKLVIPIDRFDEAMVVLHKLTCLPLSDFAYIKNKVNEHPFEMAPEDLNRLLQRQDCNKWLYETASQTFDKQFREIGQKYCTTENCTDEIAQLREENKKLAQNCGVIDVKTSGKMNTFLFDATKLRQDYNLALRCISFSFGVPGSVFDEYNRILRSAQNLNFSKNYVARSLAESWMKRAYRVLVN